MTRTELLELRVQDVFRRGAWIAAIGAVLVGAFGLIFPGAAVRSVALLLGVYLIVAGISRVYSALTAPDSPTRWRWVIGIMGALVIVAGVVCLSNPFATLIAVEVILGIGWMIDGVLCMVAAFALFRQGMRTALVLTGLVSFILGLIVLVTPGAALVGFLFLAAIFLVVIGVVGILGLLISRSRRRQATA